MFLFDGRANESAFELMQREGAFPRLVELIGDRKDDASGLHRMLLELLFEMARIQKLSKEDLGMQSLTIKLSEKVLTSMAVVVDDGFILYLFQLTERLSDDAEDPYHYPIIRVLVSLSMNTEIIGSADTRAACSERAVHVPGERANFT